MVVAPGCTGHALVARLVFRCTPAALRSRLFLAQGRRLPADLVTLLTGPPDGVAYLAVDGHRPVALVNVAPDPDGGVEVGLLVADGWRRRGLGRWLMLRALADPRWAGLPVHATVDPDNIPVRRLLHTLPAGARLVDFGPGEYHYRLDPAQPAVPQPAVAQPAVAQPGEPRTAVPAEALRTAG
ncbi:MAG TPA: GNAT family N-acetyltransferase [Pseudonocardia sp.]